MRCFAVQCQMLFVMLLIQNEMANPIISFAHIFDFQCEEISNGKMIRIFNPIEMKLLSFRMHRLFVSISCISFCIIYHWSKISSLYGLQRRNEYERNTSFEFKRNVIYANNYIKMFKNWKLKWSLLPMTSHFTTDTLHFGWNLIPLDW